MPIRLLMTCQVLQAYSNIWQLLSKVVCFTPSPAIRWGFFV